MAAMMQPQIILLEGTDTSQGRAQVVSNINACTAVADSVRTTLGPRGMDKLIHDNKGGVTISIEGATIMRLLDIVHPTAKILVDIAKSQDSEANYPEDGTSLRPWLTRRALDYLEHDMVFLPINVTETHWYLGVINSKRHEIQVLDSLGKIGRDDLKTTDRNKSGDEST
ncbi:unnamed protein product [Urochloa humidicola]